jgi:hypothetical protein
VLDSLTEKRKTERCQLICHASPLLFSLSSYSAFAASLSAADVAQRRFRLRSFVGAAQARFLQP